MRKLSIPLLVALIAIAGIAAVADGAKKKGHTVNAEVTIAYDDGVPDIYDPYDYAAGPSFSGEVRPKGKGLKVKPKVVKKQKKKLQKKFGKKKGKKKAKKKARKKAKKKTRKLKKVAKRKCRKGRTIVVKQPGQAPFGTTKTNADGEYFLDATGVTPGSYRAVARKKKPKKGGVVCKKAKSKLITVS